jgi:hypothetical protein
MSSRLLQFSRRLALATRARAPGTSPLYVIVWCALACLHGRNLRVAYLQYGVLQTSFFMNLWRQAAESDERGGPPGPS